MATKVTDDYLITITTRLVGDENYNVMAQRISVLERENRKLASSAGVATTGMQNLNRSTARVGDGVSRNSSLFQNLSYQVTDFAVQTQGGVSALRAFSQQAPQVAGALGAAGIGGAFGIAAFAVASLAAALAPAAIAMLDFGSASEKALKSLESLDDKTLNLDDFISDSKEAQEDLRGLTSQGLDFARAIELVNKRIGEAKTQQYFNIIKDGQKQFKEFTDEFERVQRSINTAGTTGAGTRQAELDARYFQGILKNLEEQFEETYGVSSLFAPRIAADMEQLFSGGDSGGQSARRLLVLLSDVKTESEEGAEFVNNLRTAIEGLSGQDFFGDLGDSSDEATKKLERAATAWKAYTDSIRTPNEILIDTTAAIREAGKAAGATEEEIRRVLDQAYAKYDESAFKKLADDADTMYGGVLRAQQAIKELVVSEGYLAGIRDQMSQFDVGTEQYRKLVGLLGDAATPLEQINSALGEITDKRTGIDELRAAFEKFKESYTGNTEDLKKLEESLFDSGKKIETMWSEISIAIGNSLSRAVGDFTDAMFDAEADFNDVIDSMLQNIAKLIIQITILKQLEAGFPGFFGTSSSGSPPASSAGDAAGASVAGRSASNVVGLASAPFNASAQAYSVGPLISASTSALTASNSSTVNVFNNNQSEVEVSEVQNQRGGSTIDVMINNSVNSAISKGRFDKTFNNLYGLKRRGS